MDFGRFSLLSRKKSNSRLFENFLRFVVFTLLSAFYGILQHSKTSGTFNSLLFRLDSLISRKIWSLHISKIRSSTFVRQIHRIFVSFSSRKFHWRYSLLFDGKNQSPECSRSFSEVGVFMGFYNTLQSSGTFISLLFVSQKKFQAIFRLYSLISRNFKDDISSALLVFILNLAQLSTNRRHTTFWRRIWTF